MEEIRDIDHVYDVDYFPIILSSSIPCPRLTVRTGWSTMMNNDGLMFLGWKSSESIQ